MTRSGKLKEFRHGLRAEWLKVVIQDRNLGFRNILKPRQRQFARLSADK
jgi:hypothetical protein